MRDDSPFLRPPTAPTSRCSGGFEPMVDAGEFLSLIGDEHTQEILTTLGEQSLPAREIVDRSSVSRSTVYRRLDRLEEVGLVETTMSLHPDGHHRKEFRVVVEKVELRPGDDTLVADADYRTTNGSEDPRPINASD
jgi:DNA-binding transcriptional ArsR family regulator